MNFFSQKLKTPDDSTQEYRNARDSYERISQAYLKSVYKSATSKSEEDIRATSEIYEKLQTARAQLDKSS